MSNLFRMLLVLALFALSAGFQLWIFTALYQKGGSIHLVDPFPEMRLFEFVLASAIFTTSLIALYEFFVLLWKVGQAKKEARVAKTE